MTRKVIGLRLLPDRFFFGRTAAAKRFVNRMARRGVEVERPGTIIPALAAELAEHFREVRCKKSVKQFGLLRDEGFWLHRYAAPHVEYGLVVLRRAGKIVGFASYFESESQTFGFKHVKIVDISPEPEQIKTLVKAVSVFASSPLMTIYFSCPDATTYRKVTRLFPVKRANRTGTPSDHVLIKVMDAAESSRDMSDGANWALGFIDNDGI